MDFYALVMTQERRKGIVLTNLLGLLGFSKRGVDFFVGPSDNIVVKVTMVKFGEQENVVEGVGDW